jgi:predicted dehydrogenase
MINIGVVGVGYLGQHHARIYSELSKEFADIKLVAVVDKDIEKAKYIAKKYECKAFSDHRYILEIVDAVSIASPTITHYGISIDFINAKKDILLEKPITATLEEANNIVSLSQKSETIVQIGHLERFNPVFPIIRSLIKKPVFFDSERISPFLGRGVDVDITLDLMIHDLDIILSLIRQLNGGSIDTFGAVGASIVTDKIDVAKAWIEFENGIYATFTTSRISSEKKRSLKIYENDTFFVVDYQNMSIERFFIKNGKLDHESILVEKKEPLKEEIKDFIDCIKNRRNPEVSAIEGRDALNIALKIGEKIRK